MQRSVSKRTSLALKDLRIVQQPKPDTSKTKDLLRRVSQLVNEIKSNPPEPCEGTADDGRYIDLVSQCIRVPVVMPRELIYPFDWIFIELSFAFCSLNV
ncbi:hypothetical protein D915_010614 [Fasciola hepatica]|uniref:Uncharacterized protein n=1 Tax=Fasciola hepatica TaxID=6192 RepID=A0A4E0RPG8_FASHE|nr:hypothetical protein D915_010614 [Fasciola hepatica]